MPQSTVRIKGQIPKLEMPQMQLRRQSFIVRPDRTNSRTMSFIRESQVEVSHEWPLPNVLDNSGNRSIFIESPIADSAKGCSASSELELVSTTIRSGCPTRQFGRRHWPHWRDRPSASAMSNGRSMVISSPLKEHFNAFSFTSVYFS